MRIIPLTKGKQTIVDDDDFIFLSNHKWQYLSCRTGYAVAHEPRSNNKIIYMHRIILRAQKNQQVDHINHNTLDNRKGNLRLATAETNRWNTKIMNVKNRRFPYKGVRYSEGINRGIRYKSPEKSRKKYKSFITVKGKSIYLGVHRTPEEAAQAYNVAAIKYFGQYAYLNKI